MVIKTDYNLRTTLPEQEQRTYGTRATSGTQQNILGTASIEEFRNILYSWAYFFIYFVSIWYSIHRIHRFDSIHY